MIIDSIDVLSELRDLERQIGKAAAYRDSQKRGRTEKAPPTCACAVDRLQLVTGIAVTTSRIKQQIIPMDGLGETSESLTELTLRARRMVVLAELTKLRALYSLALPRHKQRRVVDFAAFVRERMDRITRRWIEDRDRARTDRVAFRVALCRASQALRTLGTAPAPDRFLRAGSRRDDWPVLAESCTRMRAAFKIRIAVQPDHPILRYRWTTAKPDDVRLHDRF